MRTKFATGKSFIEDRQFTHLPNLRDIKPENFLLRKENDISSIKLIDFGLSKALTENELMNTPNGTVSKLDHTVLAILYCPRSPQR
jgi:serine/threonine protein kinase